MTEMKTDRKHLERRRDEILAELDRVNNDLRLELDRDPEEQAIQLEQDQVSVTMEHSLREELDRIEEQLAEGSE
jgi:RNA polymerase-binding transcription factor DksA